MIAKLRVVVEVPYDYDVGEPDEDGNLPGMQQAAEHANTVVMDDIKAKAATVGTVIDDECLVEEVRQA